MAKVFCKKCGALLGDAKVFSREELAAHQCQYCGNRGAEITSGIPGVGKDAPMVVNEKGGKQSKVDYAFDALDPKAMFAMCKVLKEGRDKYGSDENWRAIPVREHINHAIIHLYAYLAGDEQDEHLSHAMCRAMFACSVDMEMVKLPERTGAACNDY